MSTRTSHLLFRPESLTISTCGWTRDDRWWNDRRARVGTLGQGTLPFSSGTTRMGTTVDEGGDTRVRPKDGKTLSRPAYPRGMVTECTTETGDTREFLLHLPSGPRTPFVGKYLILNLSPLPCPWGSLYRLRNVFPARPDPETEDSVPVSRTPSP